MQQASNKTQTEGTRAATSIVFLHTLEKPLGLREEQGLSGSQTSRRLGRPTALPELPLERWRLPEPLKLPKLQPGAQLQGESFSAAASLRPYLASVRHSVSAESIGWSADSEAEPSTPLLSAWS